MSDVVCMVLIRFIPCR